MYRYVLVKVDCGDWMIGVAFSRAAWLTSCAYVPTYPKPNAATSPTQCTSPGPT